VINESEPQDEKSCDPTISSRDGIKIDSSDELENAYDSIRVKREFDSNLIDESDLHLEKLFDPRISIFPASSIADDFEKLRINL
jgi:hypothetical protein